MTGDGGPRLPKPPASWDGLAAQREAVEKHVLRGGHDSEEAAYNAALGHVISSYLESLSPREYLTAVLTIKGPEGFPEGQLLGRAGEHGHAQILDAARELLAAGKLRRVRKTNGEIFWVPAGPLLAEPNASDAHPQRIEPFRRRPGGRTTTDRREGGPP